ncbi:hypothetical protein BTA51_21550 [Hahella sp. CCB-MM4]|uniref:hypothetical protein n=1 Tax=Hahella sp. (strain CCB-MM4) TaxID=1926491 RepID=UPI000B9ADEED|nr:hypothetical protein [Hahella sp. CCB-MM4]OZG71237.1 hypothetical protein BTA51_21550 [Hahella sp. CCB-MM4]
MLRTCLFLVLSVVLVSLGGCGSQSEGDVLPIRILGSIPGEAYVGVEYYYEVGVDGGDGTLNYSLTNAPDWLETDIIDNALRRGVVLRGIPGATGADDSFNEDDTIILSVTDGNSVATVEFGVEVSQASFSDISGTIDEGGRATYPEDKVDSNGNGVIDAADDTEPGTICMQDADGKDLFTKSDIDYFVEHQLDPDAWDGKKVRLEFLPVILSDPFYLDVLGTFSLVDLRTQSGADYLESVQKPSGGSANVKDGYFAVPAGDTTCYIMLFVVDDLIAEDDENFAIDLAIDKVGDITADVSNRATITIEDNEPQVSFAIPKVTVTESSVGRNIVIPVTVKLDRPPEQSVSAEFEVKTGTGADAEIGGSNDDLVITPSNYTVQFAKGIKEAKIYLRAPDNASGDDGDTDEFLTLGWVDTDTVRASDSTLKIYVNEWLSDVEVAIGTNAKIVEAYADDKADLYVGYQSFDGSSKGIANIVHLSRTRELIADGSYGSSLLRELQVKHDDVNILLNDIAIDRFDSSADEIINLYVLATVDKVIASIPSGSGFTLGGDDILLQKYENVNGVGDFELVWERQIGTEQNDFAESMSIDSEDNINIVGGTHGGFLGGSNAGGKDGFFMKVDASGEVTSVVQYGTDLDEYLNHVAQDGPSNISTFAIVERSQADKGDNIQMRSLSKDGSLRRSAEYGSPADDQVNAVNPAPTGAILAGATLDAIPRLSTNQGGWDAFLVYHRNLSEITAVEQWGTSGDDRALDTKQVESQVYVSGYSTGNLFGTNAGGEDGWAARYDIVDDEELDTEVFEEVWKHQIGTSGDERLVKVVPTLFGKLFGVFQEEVGGINYLKVENLSVVDGISQYAACRETTDGC